MYIRSVKVLKIKLTFKTVHRVARDEALLDSGASKNTPKAHSHGEIWKKEGSMIDSGQHTCVP